MNREVSHEIFGLISCPGMVGVPSAWCILLTIIETPQSRSVNFTHSGGCPVSLGVTAMMRVAPRDRGAGLTQLKFGVWIAFVGICRPVPPVPGAGLWLEADVTL